MSDPSNVVPLRARPASGSRLRAINEIEAMTRELIALLELERTGDKANAAPWREYVDPVLNKISEMFNLWHEEAR